MDDHPVAGTSGRNLLARSMVLAPLETLMERCPRCKRCNSWMTNDEIHDVCDSCHRRAIDERILKVIDERRNIYTPDV